MMRHIRTLIISKGYKQVTHAEKKTYRSGIIESEKLKKMCFEVILMQLKFCNIHFKTTLNQLI